MSRYRRISLRMNGDAKFRSLSDPQPCGKSLWFHLLTGPHTGIIPGLSSAGEAQLAETLGWSLESFRSSFQEVTSQGMAEADWGARLLWLPKAIAHNKPQNPNVVRNWSEAWEELPECDLKVKAYQALRAFMESLGEGYAKAFLESFRESLPNTGTGTGTGTGVGRRGLDGPASPLASGKKPRPRDLVIDSAWEVYDEVEAVRPAGGLLAKWRKDLFRGNGEWMLRVLRDLASRGALSKGDGYVSQALAGYAERHQLVADAPPANGGGGLLFAPRAFTAPDGIAYAEHPEDPGTWLRREAYEARYPDEPLTWPELH